jgi:hypothetical protein
VAAAAAAVVVVVVVVVHRKQNKQAIINTIMCVKERVCVYMNKQIIFN